MATTTSQPTSLWFDEPLQGNRFHRHHQNSEHATWRPLSVHVPWVTPHPQPNLCTCEVQGGLPSTQMVWNTQIRPSPQAFIISLCAGNIQNPLY